MRYLVILAISLLFITGLVLTAGCGEKTELNTPGATKQLIRDVTANEAFSLIQQNQDNPDFIIIDVRTPKEFAEAHIENAINIDFRSATFKNEISKLDRNKKYLIYCRSGNRSRGALDAMVELGFKQVYHLSDGIVKWIEEGYPVTS